MTRRRVLQPCALGGVAAGALFTWMLASGHWDFLQRHTLGGFYDAQAHSLLHGHWDIPRDKLGFEAFVIHGKTYTYLGPWPSILRLPIAAVTTRLDGRLTQLSILLAFVVLIVATTQLLVRVRSLARPEEAVTPAEQLALGTFVFVTGAGSVVLFLASRPVVYHEAELWGAAWSVAAFAAILEYVQSGSRRAIVAIGITTTLAFLSRGSVALAPLVAGALVLGGRVLRRRDRDIAWLGVALAVPLVLYAYVNYARFGTLFGLPIDKQIATIIDPIRPKIFKGTHGELFAPKFVPTDIVALLRPDALAFSRVFPYITFPASARVIGNVTFASIQPSASLPASMPFLFVLAVVGVVTMSRRRSSYAPMRPLAIGGVVGCFGVITIPFVDHRYLSDFVPLVVACAAVGMYAVLGRRGRHARRAWLVVLGALALFSVLANVALALAYQREYSPFTSDADRAAFVRFQRAAPGGSHMPVRRGNQLPNHPGAAGTVFVVGDCAGVYWSDGVGWHAVERTHASGLFPLDITVGDEPTGTRETLLIAGPPGADDQIVLEHAGPRRVRFVLASPRLPTESVGPVQPVPVTGALHVNVLYDVEQGHVSVTIRSDEVLGLVLPLAGEPIRVAGRDLPGSVRLLGTPARFCHELEK